MRARNAFSERERSAVERISRILDEIIRTPGINETTIAEVLKVPLGYISPSKIWGYRRKLWERLQPMAVLEAAKTLGIGCEVLDAFEQIWRIVDRELMGLRERDGDWETNIPKAIKLGELGIHHYHQHRWDRADECLERAFLPLCRVAPRPGDRHFAVALEVALLWGQRLTHMGRIEEALAVGEKLLVMAADCRSLDPQLFLLASLGVGHAGYTERHAGHGQRALRLAHDCVKMLEERPVAPWALIEAHRNYAKVCGLCAVSRRGARPNASMLQEGLDLLKRVDELVPGEPTEEIEAIHCFIAWHARFELLHVSSRNREALKWWDYMANCVWADKLSRRTDIPLVSSKLGFTRPLESGLREGPRGFRDAVQVAISEGRHQFYANRVDRSQQMLLGLEQHDLWLFHQAIFRRLPITAVPASQR